MRDQLFANKAAENYTRGIGRGELCICYNEFQAVTSAAVVEMIFVLSGLEPIKHTFQRQTLNSNLNFLIFVHPLSFG